MKTEATETTKTTGRDDYACTTQLYRLICIHNPGRTTGPRISGKSKKAVVQKEEHPAGQECLMPGIAVGNGQSTPQMPEGTVSIKPGLPLGSGNLMPQEPAGSKDTGAGSPAPVNPGGGAP